MRFLGFAALAGLVISACGGGSPDAEPMGPVAVYPWKPGDGTMDALIGGVLVRDGPCLYIRAARGDGRVLLAFPETRAAWDEGQGVLFFDGRRIAPGEPTTLSGGFTAERNFDGWPAPPDRRCDATDLWLAGGLGPVLE
jgi:hypothetical protein